MVKETLAAAETLDAEGISAEVIDLATLKPYDEETLLSSVAKNRTLHHRARSCNGPAAFGAEIAALIAERRGLTSLLAPVARVTGYDTVMPLAPALSSIICRQSTVSRPPDARLASSVEISGNTPPCGSSCCPILVKVSKRPRS